MKKSIITLITIATVSTFMMAGKSEAGSRKSQLELKSSFPYRDGRIQSTDKSNYRNPFKPGAAITQFAERLACENKGGIWGQMEITNGFGQKIQVWMCLALILQHGKRPPNTL